LPPIERAIEAGRRLDAMGAERAALSAVRRDALYEASMTMTHAQIAARLGITRQAVSKAIAESALPGEDLALMDRALKLLADLPAVDDQATGRALGSARLRAKAAAVSTEGAKVPAGALTGDELDLVESAVARAVVILGTPAGLRYGVQVGWQAAAAFADPATGPLARRPGRGVEEDDGWIWVDETALESLRGIPAGDDWRLDEEDGPVLVFLGVRYPVVELDSEDLGPLKLHSLIS
jgi:hypothetical protein